MATAGASRSVVTRIGVPLRRGRRRGGDRPVARRRLTVAVDVGRVVDADGVRNQIEGGAIQATSWALFEKVQFDRHAITSTGWESYPIARFSQVPELDIRVVPRPDEPPLGSGQATQGPAMAAIGNALADALGIRVRTLPFTTDNIVAAINAAG